MRSEPVASTRPTIRYRPGVPKPVRRKATRGNETDKVRFTVTSDWPDALPASGGEVAVIESFLSHSLDDLLSAAGLDPLQTAHSPVCRLKSIKYQRSL